MLRLDDKGLSLCQGTLEVRGDFSHLAFRTRPSNLHRELIVRACKVKGVAAPHVIDATAGFGNDSFLLASAGFTVTLCERDPIIAALLRDAIDRAARNDDLAPAASRMKLMEKDSITVLAAQETPPDVVLLDPMFPARSKSAAVNKKLQLLQQLEKPCEDENALMDAALAAQPRKVVVKRPAKGPWFSGRKPSYTLSGKAIRFDCYVCARPIPEATDR